MNSRKIFTNNEKKLEFPFYKMEINVPTNWTIFEAGYPNRIDLQSNDKFIKIWFKSIKDNDEVIIDKIIRKQSYENRAKNVSSVTLEYERFIYSLANHFSDNIIYIEYFGIDGCSEQLFNWFSMVYNNDYEVQIALAKGDLNDELTRKDFEWVIKNLEKYKIKSSNEMLSENIQFHDDAAENRYENVIKKIKEGISVNSRNYRGGTPLMIASKRGHFKIVQTLLESGADPNLGMYDHYTTALHTAAQEGYNEIIKLLLKCGANVNITTSNGETPLMSAAIHGQSSTVELLIKNGADIRIKAKNGKTAYDFAKKYGQENINILLRVNNEKKRFFAWIKSLLGLNNKGGS